MFATIVKIWFKLVRDFFCASWLARCASLMCIFNFRSAIRVPTSQLHPPIFINFCQQTFTNTKYYFDTQSHVFIFKENIKFSHKNDKKWATKRFINQILNFYLMKNSFGFGLAFGVRFSCLLCAKTIRKKHLKKYQRSFNPMIFIIFVPKFLRSLLNVHFTAVTNCTAERSFLFE